MGTRLLDKVCIVTGGAQGIGAAYARACAAEGADVAIVDLKRIDQAESVEADIKEVGRRSLAIKADVTNAAQMMDMGRRVLDEFGRIDCLVNNAGLMFDQLTATWDDFLAVNFIGAINASNAVIPRMWEQRSGSIVNISSTAAYPLSLPMLFDMPDDAPPPRIAPGTTALVAGDIVTPGHTAFTRMFREPSSCAMVLVWRMIIHLVMP